MAASNRKKKTPARSSGSRSTRSVPARRRKASRAPAARRSRETTAPLAWLARPAREIGAWITAPARFGLALSFAATSLIYVALRSRARA